MKYYLGIDGGGTKTTVALTDEYGKILKKAVGKTINFYSVGMEKARENLADVIEEISTQTGAVEFEGVFIGCSALDGAADSDTVNALCRGIINAEKIGMDSDTYIAFKAMDGETCPVVVICGTGSMAIGIDEMGNSHISGGWGHILGDEGSAYAIALSALKKCAAFADSGEKTELLHRACLHFGVKDFREVIPFIYSLHTSKDAVAAFGAVVGELSQNGDEICRSIITEEAQKLAFTAKILLKKVKKCVKIGLYGGVFLNNPLFRELFTKAILTDFPETQIALIETSPEESAARIARNLK